MTVEQLIYTDLPRGKGLDPSSAGYQIKACSEGLSAEARGLLSSICTHYGDAVHRHAPCAAKERERAWRAQLFDDRDQELAQRPPAVKVRHHSQVG